jgi:hypothetical protein
MSLSKDHGSDPAGPDYWGAIEGRPQLRIVSVSQVCAWSCVCLECSEDTVRTHAQAYTHPPQECAVVEAVSGSVIDWNDPSLALGAVLKVGACVVPASCCFDIRRQSVALHVQLHHPVCMFWVSGIVTMS